jgi:photosystem II stability/assembly factor-like uncharacterized protein
MMTRQIVCLLRISLLSIFLTISLSFAGFSQVLQQDYDALLAFYTATNGDGWTTKTGWLGPNDATVGTWFGVVVENGRVVQINLPNNNLSGTLPAQLADLTALRFLILGPDQPPFTNQIGGTIPSGIGNLTDLIRLNLQFNTFTGSIPSELSNLPALVRLELSANQLSGAIPSALGNLSTLQFLALGSNSLTGAIPSELGQLTALTSISLAANQLSGSIPVSLGNLSQLISLQLQLNQLSGSLPIELSNLTALRNFYFNNNQLTGGVPSWLGDMTALEIVQGDNNALAGSLPATLGNLSNLTTLTFTNCQLTGTVPASLTNLGALTFLRLNTNFFTSLPDLSTIGGLSGTSNFQIQNNNLTFESIEPVVAKNPTYSPQRQIPGIANFNVNEGDPITLTYSVGGIVNSYQWYKNNVAISGATNTTFTIPSAALSDAGSYHLEITNAIATALTLRTETTVVTVNSISSPQWVKVDVGSTDGLFDVQFADARAGFTGGNSGEFIRTTDGGETWERLTDAIGFGKSIRDIHFIDRHRGWVVGAQGLLARTENGGLNWTLTTFPGVTINTVWFTSALNGWLGYGNGSVFRTVNGGVSWTQQTTGTSGIIDEIQFVNDQVGYIVSPGSGSGPLLLKTTNSGQSWQLINTNNGGNALYFFNESKGFVGSLNGFLFSTTDGGQSFVSEGRPSNSTIHAVDFASDNIGWFSGLNNTLYSTTNGGTTWVRETTGLSISDQIRRVHSIRTDFAWATSLSEGVLLKYGQMGNVVVDGYESLVQKTFSSAGEQDFNEAGKFTGTAVRIAAVSGSSTVSVRLQQEAPANRQLALLPAPQFANMRWLVTTTGTLPQGYEIVFNLENIPGLPIHTDKTMFRVARRNTEGTGGFELATSRFEGNKLIAAGTGNHEFTLVLVAGPTVTDISVCSGANAVLTASGAQAGQTYRWYQNNTDVTPLFTGNPFVVTSVVADATYYVSLTDGVLESIRVPVTVIIGSALDKPLVTNASACTSSSFVLTATGAALGYEYVWYENLTDTNPIVKNLTGEFTTPVLSVTRSYFVSILTNEGCESERTEVIAEISVLPAPTVTAQGGFGFCEGGSVTLAGPSGFTSYLWSDNSTNKDLTVNTAGTYTLRVVDTNGCESQPTSVVVTQNANPVATITMSNDRLVTGQAASYQWFLFDEAIVGATESFLEINVLRYGIYSVQLISSAGCAVLSDPFVYLITGYEADQEKGVVLYPNPTSGTLSIQIENDVRMKSYTIYNNLGKTMLQREVVSIEFLDVTDWPSGIYSVQIEVENKTLTRRIIKL